MSRDVTPAGRVVVPVADQDEAIAFYSRVLGFTVVADMPFGDGVDVDSDVMGGDGGVPVMFSFR